MTDVTTKRAQNALNLRAIAQEVYAYAQVANDPFVILNRAQEFLISLDIEEHDARTWLTRMVHRSPEEQRMLETLLDHSRELEQEIQNICTETGATPLQAFTGIFETFRAYSAMAHLSDRLTFLNQTLPQEVANSENIQQVARQGKQFITTQNPDITFFPGQGTEGANASESFSWKGQYSRISALVATMLPEHSLTIAGASYPDDTLTRRARAAEHYADPQYYISPYAENYYHQHFAGRHGPHVMASFSVGARPLAMVRQLAEMNGEDSRQIYALMMGGSPNWTMPDTGRLVNIAAGPELWIIHPADLHASKPLHTMALLADAAAHPDQPTIIRHPHHRDKIILIPPLNQIDANPPHYNRDKPHIRQAEMHDLLFYSDWLEQEAKENTPIASLVGALLGGRPLRDVEQAYETVLQEPAYRHVTYDTQRKTTNADLLTLARISAAKQTEQRSA